jgi:outer membrane protein assembly factor BamC
MILLRQVAVCSAVVLLATGCSWFKSKDDYKSATARANQPLEVPPELSSPTMDDRYAIPDAHAQTSYSDYTKGINAQGTTKPAVATGSAVLPKIDGAHIERDRDQRWLVVKGEPDKVWPVIREFWIDAGYPLVRESPEVGIMETDWYEDRAKIPMDIFRRTVGKAFEGLYSMPRRDKFRTRLEKGAVPGTTEVFVSNRAVEELYTNEYQDHTVWNPLPADKELEAEMLNRMALKIGGEEAKVNVAAPTAPAGQIAKAASVAAPAAEARNAVLENSGAGPLVVNDGFDRAWRRVGLALDRTGFTVEDRDRSKGLFFVRYIDPDVDLNAGQKKSWTEKLMFWKSADKNSQPQYRIYVSDAGANASQVVVQDQKGDPEKTSTGKKILGLLYEQLK